MNKFGAFYEYFMKELLVLQKNAQAPKRKLNRKSSIILIVAIVLFVGFFAVQCIINYSQAKDNKRQAAAIDAQIAEIAAENETKENFLKEENHDEYYEKIAREDYNYGKPGERVFYDSSVGN